MNELVINLPANLTGERFRQSFFQVPIVNKHTASYHFACLFAPISTLTGIRFNDVRLKDASAEAVCSLAGYVSWIRAHANTFHLHCEPGLNLRRCGLSPDLSVVDDHNPSWPIPLCKIDLGSSPQTLPLSVELRERIAQNTLALVQCLEKSQIHLESEEHEVVRTFLQEGLTNVAEHAYVNSTCYESAWVAAGEYRFEELRSVLSDNPHDPTLGWCNHHQTNGAKSILELCILDTGQGVVESLGKAYLESGKERKLVLTQKGRSSYWPLHDKIIQWSLSPFGSRKAPEHHTSSSLATIWRGLYRVFVGTVNIGGYLAVRSGLGMAGHIATDSSVLPLRMRRSGTPWDTRALPGTILTMRLALGGIRSRVFSISRSTDAEVDSQDAQLELVEFPRHTSNLHQNDMAFYSETIKKMFAGTLDQVQSEPSHLLSRKYVVFVHPFLRLPPASAFPDSYQLGQHTIATKDESIRTQQACLFNLIEGISAPHQICIHMFLEATDACLRQAQREFSGPRPVDENDVSPVTISGFANVRSGHIHWFIHIPNEPKASLELALHGKTHSPTGKKVPVWWGEVENLFPRAFKITKGSTCELTFNLPAEVSRPLLQRALQTSLQEISQTSSASRWFWKAPSDSPTTCVRTSSNDLVILPA